MKQEAHMHQEPTLSAQQLLRFDHENRQAIHASLFRAVELITRGTLHALITSNADIFQGKLPNKKQAAALQDYTVQKIIGAHARDLQRIVESNPTILEFPTLVRDAINEEKVQRIIKQILRQEPQKKLDREAQLLLDSYQSLHTTPDYEELQRARNAEIRRITMDDMSDFLRMYERYLMNEEQMSLVIDRRHPELQESLRHRTFISPPWAYEASRLPKLIQNTEDSFRFDKGDSRRFERETISGWVVIDSLTGEKIAFIVKTVPPENPRNDAEYMEEIESLLKSEFQNNRNFIRDVLAGRVGMTWMVMSTAKYAIWFGMNKAAEDMSETVGDRLTGEHSYYLGDATVFLRAHEPLPHFLQPSENADDEQLKRIHSYLSQHDTKHWEIQEDEAHSHMVNVGSQMLLIGCGYKDRFTDPPSHTVPPKRVFRGVRSNIDTDAVYDLGLNPRWSRVSGPFRRIVAESRKKVDNLSGAHNLMDRFLRGLPS